MKSLISLLCLIVAIHICGQEIPDPVLEVGLAIGEPTGISVKYWLTQRNAFDAGVGWSSNRKLLDICFDYQYHHIWSQFDGGELPVYIGGGVMVRLNKGFFLGMRLPIGTEYLFEGPRLIAFAQIAPVFRVIPKQGIFVAGGLGVRYAF